MKLVVKHGRQYTLGGRTYGEGESVEISDKFVAYLVSPKGPLERPTQRRQATTDLPPEVMSRAMVAEPAQNAPPYPEPEDETPARRRSRRYGRRDLEAEE